MRVSATALIFVLSATTTKADKDASEACKGNLSSVGQVIYDAALAQHPTQSTGRKIIKTEVEKLMAEGKLTLSEGRKEGQAVGKCLELLK